MFFLIFITGIIFIYIINYIFNDGMQTYSLFDSIPYYLNEYIMIDVIPYSIICMTCYFVLKKYKKENSNAVISGLFNGVFLFLLLFTFIERKAGKNLDFLNIYETYDHIGLILFAILIGIISFIKTTSKKNDKTEINKEENRIVKPEEKVVQNLNIIGKDFYKLNIIGFISTIPVVIFRIIYYMMKQSM